MRGRAVRGGRFRPARPGLAMVAAGALGLFSMAGVTPAQAGAWTQSEIRRIRLRPDHGDMVLPSL